MRALAFGLILSGLAQYTPYAALDPGDLAVADLFRELAGDPALQFKPAKALKASAKAGWAAAAATQSKGSKNDPKAPKLTLADLKARWHVLSGKGPGATERRRTAAAVAAVEKAAPEGREPEEPETPPPPQEDQASEADEPGGSPPPEEADEVSDQGSQAEPEEPETPPPPEDQASEDRASKEAESPLEQRGGDSPRFGVGAEVRALFAEDGNWYAATVVGARMVEVDPKNLEEEEGKGRAWREEYDVRYEGFEGGEVELKKPAGEVASPSDFEEEEEEEDGEEEGGSDEEESNQGESDPESEGDLEAMYASAGVRGEEDAPLTSLDRGEAGQGQGAEGHWDVSSVHEAADLDDDSQAESKEGQSGSEHSGPKEEEGSIQGSGSEGELGGLEALAAAEAAAEEGSGSSDEESGATSDGGSSTTDDDDDDESSESPLADPPEIRTAASLMASLAELQQRASTNPGGGSKM